MRIRFINYRKYKGFKPKWKPFFMRGWYNELWTFSWFGYGIVFDWRKDIVKDLKHGRIKEEEQ